MQKNWPGQPVIPLALRANPATVPGVKFVRLVKLVKLVNLVKVVKLKLS